MRGKIKSFNDENAYGFIISDSGGPDIFFEGWGDDYDFSEGDLVEFNVVVTVTGRYAINVIKVIK